MNELIMTGYVATEPEINEFKRKRRRNKKTPQYGLAANFRISVKRSFKKKDGKKYDYFSCSAFDKSAEYIEEYIENLFELPATCSTHIEPIEDPASLNDIGIDRKKIKI